jgi:phage tail-like protein
MNQDAKPKYLYLNRDGQWTGFKSQGLKLRSDGALELLPLPFFAGMVPPSIKSAGMPSGPSGIAVTSDGTVFFSDPAGQRIQAIAGCDGRVCPLPCLGGKPGQFGRFNTPRGLLATSNRCALFAVDSGNHRVQVFDPETGQLLAVLGQPNPGATPTPGSAPGRLNTPWGLAGDSENSVYVLDYGNARVQKWNAVGNLVKEFCDNLLASKVLSQPLDLCAADVGGAIRVFVVDSSLQIFVFDSLGNSVPGPDGNTLTIGKGKLQSPMGMAASSTSLYIGDNQARRVLEFSLGDTPYFVGEARGYEGPVAALCLDSNENLWVHAGTAEPPLKLATQAAYTRSGSLWTEQPIQTDHPTVEWQRLQAVIQHLPANTHLEFLVYTSNDASDGPTTPADDPLGDPKWRQPVAAAGADLEDMYIGCTPATYLWLAARFTSDGSATPVMSQIRVQFDGDSYLDYLPAIYREETQCLPAGSPCGKDQQQNFLLRLVSLFESLYQDVEDEIASLPVLFDPKATPKDFLGWLAKWLGLELDESWSEQKQRLILSEIFKLWGRRGTIAGLRRILKLFLGVDAVIEEPIMNAAWWALPSSTASCCKECAHPAGIAPLWQGSQDSILGFTTMLAPAQPQGAVVGTSAVLDRSHLITVEEFGAPLFRDVAHQFSVQVYRGQVMCPEVLPRVRALLDQEKPAHTMYQICIVEPRMRVGYQSRVGVDTVVGGPSRSLALGSEQGLGQDTVLAGAEATRLGQSRLGVTTRVG